MPPCWGSDQAAKPFFEGFQIVGNAEQAPGAVGGFQAFCHGRLDAGLQEGRPDGAPWHAQSRHGRRSWRELRKLYTVPGISGFSSTGVFIAQTAAHGVAGGVRSRLQGGSFRAGALAGAVGHAAGKAAFAIEGKGLGAITARTAVAAVGGGTAARLGGGKFANGANTAAFAHLFNNETENIRYNIDLLQHEGRDDLSGVRGHTITLHVAKKLNFLKHRVMRFDHISSASSFYSLRHAQALINMTLNHNASTPEMIAFLADPGAARLIIDQAFPQQPTGYSVTFGKRGSTKVYNVRVVLQKPATTPEGFRVVTAVPF